MIGNSPMSNILCFIPVPVRCTAVLLLAAGNTFAGPVQVSADLAPGSANWADAPTSPVHLPAGAVFFARGQDLSPGLWSTDGTAVGTARLSPSPAPDLGSFYWPEVAAFGPRAYFAASTAAAGKELWSTDGTSAGTRQVADMVPGPEGSSPGMFTPWQGSLWFCAYEGEDTILMKTDGTAAGTARVKVIPHFSPSYLLPAGNRLVLGGRDSEVWPAAAIQIWSTDGTEAGTIQSFAGTGDFIGTHAAVGGKVIYIRFIPGIPGLLELWATDGTMGGTAFVGTLPEDGSISDFRTLGNQVFYTVDQYNEGQFRSDLWRSDGTPGGTVSVLQLVSSEQEYPGAIMAPVMHGGRAWSAVLRKELWELWSSDGRAAGTARQIWDVPGSWTYFDPLAGNESVLYFSGSFSSPAGPPEEGLFVHDGSSRRLLAPVWIRNLSEGPRGRLTGWEPDAMSRRWRLWGREDGTAPMRVLMEVQLNSASSSPRMIAASAAGDVWCVADAPGRRLVHTSTEGPWIDHRYPLAGGESGPPAIAGTSGKVFLPVPDQEAPGSGKRDLLASVNNGLVTLRPESVPLNPRHVTALTDGWVVFAGESAAGGQELWKSDGTEAGTVKVKEIRPGAEGSDPSGFVKVGQEVFFFADDGVHGQELWRSNGTEAGTVLAMDIRPGSAGSLPATPSPGTAANQILWMVADDGTNGPEVWRFQTEQGRFTGALLADIWPGSGHAAPTLLTAVPDSSRVVFAAYDPVRGQAVWQSELSGPGASLLADISPATSGQQIFQIARGAGLALMIAAEHPDYGRELWRAESGAAGASLAVDARPGPASSNPQGLLWAGERFLFSADDGIHGREPWVCRSSGLDAVMLDDVLPGTAGSDPAEFTAAGTHVVFAATRPDVGRELCRIGISQLQGAHWGLWRATHFAAGPATDDSPDSDPDRDGLTNLSEFAFGGNPVLPDTAGAVRLTPLPSGNELTFEFSDHLEAAGLRIEVQHAATPETTWSPAAASAPDCVPAATGKVRCTVKAEPFSGIPWRLFYRLRIAGW